MKKYKLKNMDCAPCAAKIEGSLAKLDEVIFLKYYVLKDFSYHHS